MARYTGPKARINRRLQTMIYENAGAVRAQEKRQTPPGMHTRGRRPSNYGLALMEKQKIKHYYGLSEKQLRRYFAKVSRMKGNTGELLLILCERRLDNVIRRAGYAKTRPQARQGCAHNHFMVNGVKTNKASFITRPGDVITLRNRKNLVNIYDAIQNEVPSDPPDWITFDAETMRATVLGLPGPSDVSLVVDVNMVVEFLSR